MKVGRESLHRTRLWAREIFYLEKVEEPPLPAFSFAQMRCNDLPKGWKRVSSHRFDKQVVAGWKYRLAFELVRSAWTSPLVTDSVAEQRWMDACDTGTDVYGVGLVSRRMGKLMGLSRRDLWALVYIRRNENVFGRCRFTRGSGVLRPTGPDSPYKSLPEIPKKIDWEIPPGCRVVVDSCHSLMGVEWEPPEQLMDGCRLLYSHDSEASRAVEEWLWNIRDD